MPVQLRLQHPVPTIHLNPAVADPAAVLPVGDLVAVLVVDVDTAAGVADVGTIAMHLEPQFSKGIPRP